MIKNERQYRITKAQAEKFATAVSAAKAREDIQPALRDLEIRALQSQIEIFESELSEYDQLKSGEQSVLVVERFDELPRALIKARIAAHMTQKDLAERLGLKPQQIQQYEATEYASASMTRIQEVIAALGITVRNQVSLPNRLPERSDNGLLLGLSQVAKDMLRAVVDDDVDLDTDRNWHRLAAWFSVRRLVQLYQSLILNFTWGHHEAAQIIVRVMLEGDVRMRWIVKGGSERAKDWAEWANVERFRALSNLGEDEQTRGFRDVFRVSLLESSNPRLLTKADIEHLKNEDASIRRVGKDRAEWGENRIKGLVRDVHEGDVEEQGRFHDRYDALSLPVHWNPASVISIGGHAKGSNAFLIGVEAFVDSLMAFWGIFECLDQEDRGRIIQAYEDATNYFVQDGGTESCRKV